MPAWYFRARMRGNQKKIPAAPGNVREKKSLRRILSNVILEGNGAVLRLPFHSLPGAGELNSCQPAGAFAQLPGLMVPIKLQNKGHRSKASSTGA